MSSSNNAPQEKKCSVNVSVDVTKIVKYSCFSSVLIVMIIFGSKVVREIFKDRI